MPEVLPIVRRLYSSSHGAAGGCLHIVLDEGNVARGHVEYCLDFAERTGCRDCAELAYILTAMSPSQIGRLRRLR